MGHKENGFAGLLLIGDVVAAETVKYHWERFMRGEDV